MTHFSVAILTKQAPTPELIDKLMAPYQEGGGEDGAFVRDVDITEETRQEYETRSERRLKSPDGKLKRAWEDEFYRIPTDEESEKIGPLAGVGGGDGLRWHSRDWNDGKGHSTRVQFVPEGWTEVEVKATDMMTFAEFVRDWHSYEAVPESATPDYEEAHSHGYFVTNEAGEVTKVIRRYNPAGYWDWYEVGGRWSGELRVLDPSEAVAAQDHWTGEAPEDGYDICRRGNLDVQHMRQTCSGRRREWINEIAGKAGVGLEVVEAMLHLHRGIHAKWLELPEPRPRGREYDEWLAGSVPDGETLGKVVTASFNTPELKDGQSLEEFINDVFPLATHAVIREGKWIQASRMGMFASQHDETMSAETWSATMWKMVEELPEDHWVTIVDCHV
jgi:hypothetical protein